MFSLFPFSYPVDKDFQYEHDEWGKKFIVPGFCKYPLIEWRETGQPHITTYGWWVLACIFSLGAEDIKSTLMNLLWAAKDLEQNGYQIKEKIKKNYIGDKGWRQDSDMPGSFAEFQQLFNTHIQGFHIESEGSDDGRLVTKDGIKRNKEFEALEKKFTKSLEEYKRKKQYPEVYKVTEVKTPYMDEARNRREGVKAT